MRFAVSLLMFICVASVVGTVLQNRSSSNYIDQFGPFWYEVFDKFSIWHVYNSWWFLLIMAFLVVSTTVCLIRNAPRCCATRARSASTSAPGLRAFPHVESQEPTDVPSGDGPERSWDASATRCASARTATACCWRRRQPTAWGMCSLTRPWSSSALAGCSTANCRCGCRSCSAAKAHRREHADLQVPRAAGCPSRASAPACWCRGRPGLHRRGHGGRRRAGAAHAVHAQAQKFVVDYSTGMPSRFASKWWSPIPTPARLRVHPRVPAPRRKPGTHRRAEHGDGPEDAPGTFGYAVRERQDGDGVLLDGDGVLLAAKKGSANRLGYVFAHAAMVIICIGGLLDSELPGAAAGHVRRQEAHRREHADLRGTRQRRLSSTTRASRQRAGAEDGQASTAVVMVGDGALVQPMPFTLKLKKLNRRLLLHRMPAASPAKWWSPIPPPAELPGPPSRSTSRCASRA